MSKSHAKSDEPPHKPAAAKHGKKHVDDEPIVEEVTTVLSPQPPPPPPKPNVVRITAEGFVPKELPVRVGSIVTFENVDSIVHNVTFALTPIISEDVSPGAGFHHTVTATGDHVYFDRADIERKGVLKAT